MSNIKVIGSPLPIRTGAYAFSAGMAGDLAPGFDANDLQAIDAPNQICTGGVFTDCWASASGDQYAILAHSSLRAS